MFEPNEQQQQDLNDWFAEYDELTRRFEFEQMADRGLFPMYVISDDSSGNGVTRTWLRDDFIQSMKAAMENTPDDIEYKTVRKAMMVNSNIAIVLTKWTTGKDGADGTLKYADIMLRKDGTWRFQTMIQGGWGDFL